MYKINTLLKLDRKLYHTQDLSLLWNITNKNTLYTTVKRYVQKGILIPIQKGFYTTIPVGNIEPVAIGVEFLHTFAYTSCESILFERGIISQSPQVITLVSSVSKKFTISGHSYLSRRLKNIFLYNPAGIEEKNNLFRASLERAVADMLYFNSKYYFDNRLLINWDRVNKLQKEIGYL